MIRVSHQLALQSAAGGLPATADNPRPAWAEAERMVRQSARRDWAGKPARSIAPAGCASPRTTECSLRFVNPLTESGWDQRASRHPRYTVFHSAAWAAVLADTYSFQPQYSIASAGGQDVGLLPFVETRSLLGQRRMVSLPFTDACPPLLVGPGQSFFDRAVVGADAAGEAGSWPALWGKLVEASASRRWRTVELRDCPVPAPGAIPSEEFHGHTLDLSAGPDELGRKFDPAVRRAIRKSSKEDLQIEIRHDLSAMQAYFDLHCQTRRRHGLPPQPFKFFAAIARHLTAAGKGFLVLALHRGQPIAGGVFLHTSSQAIYKFGASLEAFQNLRANNALFSHAIKHCCERGLKNLDFGRTALLNEGLRRFKLGWGTLETRVCYYKYDVAGRSFLAAKDLTDGWHNQVFRWLPVPVSRWIGAFLYRYAA